MKIAGRAVWNPAARFVKEAVVGAAPKNLTFAKELGEANDWVKQASKKGG